MTPGVLTRFRVAPDNGWLVAAAALAATLVTAVPLLLLGTAPRLLLATGAIAAAAAVAFSPRRTLVALLLVVAGLPSNLEGATRLPLGLRPWEALLLAALLFAAIDLLYVDRLRLRRTSADALVAAFLAATVISGVVGAARGNPADEILRNLRFPLYYAAFFVVLQGVDRRDVTRLFAPLLALLGAIVSAEYILDFLGAIDLSTGHDFVRIGRREGIVLPVSMLLLANQFVHDPRRWGRALLLGLFLFTGIGFALTMGRGMWAAFGVGLVVAAWLWHTGQPRAQRRAWKGIALGVGLLATLAVSVLAFQRVTGASISAHAVERSRSYVDLTRDVQNVARLFNYASAWERIVEHPLLGAGQGAQVRSYSFDPDANRFEAWTAWTLDSLYLTLWLKMGVAGLVLFPWLLVHVGRRAVRVFRATADPALRAFAAGAVSTLVAMALLGISDGSLVNGRFTALFAVLFGLVMVADAQRGGVS